MSEKRRDNRGRVLRIGETQRPDGRYEFKFTDLGGKRRTIYSWRLVETDKTPPGKRNTISLREAEAKIQRDTQDGIDRYAAARITLNEYWKQYLASRFDLRETSRQQYMEVYRRYVEFGLGVKPLSQIRYDDIKTLYGQILARGIKPPTVKLLHSILHPVFANAVRNGYLRVNPSEGVIAELRRGCSWEQAKRHALSEQEQEAFLSFVSSSKKHSRWMPLFTVLLGTGLRIGECLGLRWEDIDFDNNVINVNHTVVYYKGANDTARAPHINPPKTRAGARSIPMLSDVRRALQMLRLEQMRTGATANVVDGYSGFVFQVRNQRMLTIYRVNSVIRTIIDDYNATGAPPLPHFSAHNLRHTFCTRFCENETNIKVIQEIMGHSSARMTMDIYNEATQNKKAESMANLDGKIKIG